MYCPGHPGHIALKVPVYSPLFMKYIRQYAKLFCHRCGALAVTRIAKENKRLIMPETIKLNPGKGRTCPRCKYVNPHIERDPEDPTGILMTTYDENGAVTTNIFPIEMSKIFDRISDEDLKKIGKDRSNLQHPYN